MPSSELVSIPDRARVVASDLDDLLASVVIAGPDVDLALETLENDLAIAACWMGRALAAFDARESKVVLTAL